MSTLTLSIDLYANERVEMLDDARAELLGSLLTTAAQYSDEDFWHKNFVCQHGADARACAEHAYVSLIIKLRALKLWPMMPDASEIPQSPSQLRDELCAIPFNPYSPDHTFCNSLVEEFRETLLGFTFPQQLTDRETALHFGSKAGPRFGKLHHFVGSYMYGYGFLPHDFGYTSLVGAWKRRNKPDATLGNHLSDNDESDYEPSDPGTEPEEEWLSQDPRQALAELEDRQSGSNKRPRYDFDDDDLLDPELNKVSVMIQ